MDSVRNGDSLDVARDGMRRFVVEQPDTAITEAQLARELARLLKADQDLLVYCSGSFWSYDPQYGVYTRVARDALLSLLFELDGAKRPSGEIFKISKNLAEHIVSILGIQFHDDFFFDFPRCGICVPQFFVSFVGNQIELDDYSPSHRLRTYIPISYDENAACPRIEFFSPPDSLPSRATVEAYHAGLNPRSNSDRSWLGFADRMDGFSENEAATWRAHRNFFISIEKTEIVRSYKIVLLLAMLGSDAFGAEISLEELTDRVAALARKVHRLQLDFSVDLTDLQALKRLLVRNPIDAFMSAKGTGGVQYFKFDGERFGFAFEIPDQTAFATLLREILDWRLAQHLSRSDAGVRDVICRVARAGERPMLFLPEENALEEGTLPITVDGREMEAVIAKIAINVVRGPGQTANQLPTILRTWFGDDAGTPGRGHRVVLRRTTEGFAMEPVGAASAGQKTLWGRYLREAIPPTFGLTFNQAIWNAGFVIEPPHIFLLVTLAKEDMNPDHRYADHFLSNQEFSWQSQNQTTQNSKRGQMIKSSCCYGTESTSVRSADKEDWSKAHTIHLLR